MNREKPNAQQAVCCNAGCMPAESPVGLLSVHARASICVPRTTASRRNVMGKFKRHSGSKQADHL